jgi:hypothetical protein
MSNEDLVESDNLLSNSNLIKIDSETHKKQTTNLPNVPSELFEKMIDNKGISIASYNKSGFKVLLFFMSYLGCAHCQGTLDDIVSLREQLFLLNVIPIVVHNENDQTYEEWALESEKTRSISQELLHLQRTKEVKKYFKMKSVSVMKLLTAESFPTLGNVSASVEIKRLAKLGLKNIVKYVTNETATLLASCFVIADCKVISHFGKDRKYQRFDLARIVIDTDGTGIEVHTDIYSCDYTAIRNKKKELKLIELEKREKEILNIETEYEFEKEKLTFKYNQDLENLKSKYDSLIEEKKKEKDSFLNPEQVQVVVKEKKKSSKSSEKSIKEEKVEKLKMSEVLQNPKLRKFFKTFCAREYAVENVIFYEEVMEFQKLNLNKRIERCQNILKLFVVPGDDCVYQINSTGKLLKLLKERQEECPVDLFDVILQDLINETMTNVYMRFLTSDIYQDMINSTKTDICHKIMYLLVK